MKYQKVVSSLIVIFGLSYLVQGLEISSKFMSGDVTFHWATSLDSSEFDVLITKDNVSSNWVSINDTQYTVRDVLFYDAINIRLRSGAEEAEESELTFKISKVKTQIGDNVNLTWVAPYFPSAGQYIVYHTYKVNRSIFTIERSGIFYGKDDNSSKFLYITRPFESTNIAFMIHETTLDDSGYYVGGVSSEAAWNGGGVVLIVLNKPSKPDIKGETDKMLETYAALTCSSNSTSAPDYYSKHVQLSYTWFVNDTKVEGGTIQIFRFKVTRSHRYNRYSCTATEEGLESDRSDTVQINPLYGPAKLTVTPQPILNRFNQLSLKEGLTIAPYQCKVDCNPPCDMTWKYKDFTGSSHVLSKEGMLVQQHINRNMSLFLCEAKWGKDTVINKSIILDVKYLDEPILYLNSAMVFDWEVTEHTPLQISCFVNGNPVPSISLIRGQGNSKIDLEEKVDKWLNYTIKSTKCYDSDDYQCTGSSSEFNITRRMFKINVLCKPRLDESVFHKTIYGSKSGPNITVNVAVPLIANPAPQLSNFTWVFPESKPVNTSILQGDDIYKYQVESIIEMNDRKHFGNYTLMINGETITTITVITEDKPRPPTDVRVHYISNGYINLTWLSEFNGGREQYFILSLKEGSNWTVVANITDPGEGKLAHTEVGPLTPEKEHLFQLQSCNKINCSAFFDGIKVTIKDDKLEKTGLTVVYYISSSVIFLALVMVGIPVLFNVKHGCSIRKRKRNDKRIDQKSQELVEHYDDLNGTEQEDAYTALGQAHQEATYEDI